MEAAGGHCSRSMVKPGFIWRTWLAMARPTSTTDGWRTFDRQFCWFMERRNPRTEPGELDALRAALPHANIAVLPGASHSPHSERATADAVTDVVRRFLG